MGTASINSRDYAAGETVIDLPQNVARRYSSYLISFTRENWTAGVDFVLANGVVEHNIAMVVVFESSPDGVNWSSAGSAWFKGGDVLYTSGPLKGTINPQSGIHYLSVDPATGQARAKTAFLRARVNRLVPLRTGVTVAVVDS